MGTSCSRRPKKAPGSNPGGATFHLKLGTAHRESRPHLRPNDSQPLHATWQRHELRLPSCPPAPPSPQFAGKNTRELRSTRSAIRAGRRRLASHPRNMRAMLRASYDSRGVWNPGSRPPQLASIDTGVLRCTQGVIHATSAVRSSYVLRRQFSTVGRASGTPCSRWPKKVPGSNPGGATFRM